MGDDVNFIMGLFNADPDSKYKGLEIIELQRFTTLSYVALAHNPSVTFTLRTEHIDVSY